MDIIFTLQSVTDGSFLTGQAANTTVYISKDGGSYAATTNAVAEIGRGSYKVTLTSAEATFNDVLLYQPVCSGAQTNTWAIDAPTDISGLSTFNPSTDTVTIGSAQAETLATASALSSVANNVNAVKAKTDNLPTQPAAKGDIPSVESITSGLATSTNVSDAQSAIIAAIPTPPSVQDIQDGLATGAGLIALANWGDAHWSTATGYATPLDIPTAKINSIYAGLYNWQLQKAGSVESIIAKDANGDTLTESIVTRNTAGEIVQMEEDNE